MKYGFIGRGNMGGALAKALSCATKEIILADFLNEKAQELAKNLGIIAGTNNDVVENCDKIFLAVKPQMYKDVLLSIKDILQEKKPVIISIAAGIKMEKITEILGFSLPIIRIMPNTPVQVGKGLIMYDFNDLVDERTVNEFVNDMAFAGILDKIDESLIDVGTAVSGCGPAYMFMFIDALAKGGVKCGLSEDKAILYAAATMEGAAKLLLESKISPEILKQNVCSPGGSTIKGVEALEQNGLYSACEDAVKKAFERNKELGK